jgi:hypothetical protein
MKLNLWVAKLKFVVGNLRSFAQFERIDVRIFNRYAKQTALMFHVGDLQQDRFIEMIMHSQNLNFLPYHQLGSWVAGLWNICIQGLRAVF